MKLKKKFLIGMFAVSIACIILQPNKSNAALQSNGGTPATKLANDWILQIRQMQELGGTLGRTDTINTNGLTSNATDLDIHMEKNTEYGAMAILSASAYGNPNKIESGETTTGNVTGIVININGERTAATTADVSAGQTYIMNASPRYKNIYSYDVYKTKIGDAIGETKGWHGSTDTITGSWFDYYEYVSILRGYKNSIFSFNAFNGNKGQGVAAYDRPYCSRACIVVGAGI